MSLIASSDLITAVHEASKIVGTDREVRDVLASTMEEVGELATEVRVKYGKTYKDGDVDGILGESVDGILCLLDLIYLDNPSITPEEIMSVAHKKLGKWLKSETQNNL